MPVESISPLKPKRKREKRKWVVVWDTTFKRGRERAKFTAMRVPRQCPLVLLVKVGWRGGKTFGCEAGTEVEQGSTELN
jgi:hypothetical protein